MAVGVFELDVVHVRSAHDFNTNKTLFYLTLTKECVSNWIIRISSVNCELAVRMLEMSCLVPWRRRRVLRVVCGPALTQRKGAYGPLTSLGTLLASTAKA